MSFRIGFGYDIHQLESGNQLILGGVAIPSAFSIVAHSDGDALLHAISDALLGAANLEDIGSHFPSDQTVPQGIDSKEILLKVLELVEDAQYRIENIDCTVVLQQPNLSAFKKSMSSKIAEILQLDKNQVSIKAKSADKIGPVGKSEAIEVYASVLITKINGN